MMERLQDGVQLWHLASRHSTDPFCRKKKINKSAFVCFWLFAFVFYQPYFFFFFFPLTSENSWEVQETFHRTGKLDSKYSTGSKTELHVFTYHPSFYFMSNLPVTGARTWLCVGSEICCRPRSPPELRGGLEKAKKKQAVLLTAGGRAE